MTYSFLNLAASLMLHAFIFQLVGFIQKMKFGEVILLLAFYLASPNIALNYLKGVFFLRALPFLIGCLVELSQFIYELLKITYKSQKAIGFAKLIPFVVYCLLAPNTLLANVHTFVLYFCMHTTFSLNKGYFNRCFSLNISIPIPVTIGLFHIIIARVVFHNFSMNYSVMCSLVHLLGNGIGMYLVNGFNKSGANPARQTTTQSALNEHEMLYKSEAVVNIFKSLKQKQLLTAAHSGSIEDFVSYSQYMYYHRSSNIINEIPRDTHHLSVYSQLLVLHNKSQESKIQKVVGKRTYDDSYAEHVLGLLPGVLEAIVDYDMPPLDVNNMTPEELFNQTYEKGLLFVKCIRDSTEGLSVAYPGMGDFKRAWLEQVFSPTNYRPCPRDADADAPGANYNQKLIYNPDQKRYEQHTVEAKSGPKKVGVDRTDMQKNSFSLVVKGNCNIFDGSRSIAFATSADESNVDDRYTYFGNARTYDKPWYNNDTSELKDPSSFLGLQIWVQAVTTDYSNEVLARPSLSSLVGVIALKLEDSFSRLEALYNAETINCYNVVQNNKSPRVPVMIKNGDSFKPYSYFELYTDLLELMTISSGQMLLRRLKLICFKEVVPNYKMFKKSFLSMAENYQVSLVSAEELLNSVPESYEDNSRILLSGIEKYQSVDLSTATDDQILNIGKNTPQPIFESERVALKCIQSKSMNGFTGA